MEFFQAEWRAEVKDRLKKILDELEGLSFLRIQRALRVLEAINDAEAKKLLAELADGAPESMLTKEAQTVLKRVGR